MSYENNYTGIAVKEETKQRMAEMKPYDSVSWDEWTQVVLDEYAKHNDVEN